MHCIKGKCAGTRVNKIKCLFIQEELNNKTTANKELAIIKEKKLGKNPRVRAYIFPRQPEEDLTCHVNGNWHKFRLFRFLNMIFFPEENKYIVPKINKWY